MNDDIGRLVRMVERDLLVIRLLLLARSLVAVVGIGAIIVVLGRAVL